jgi:hypothetical protein
MATIRAPHNARTTEPTFGMDKLPVGPVDRSMPTMPREERFRELDTEDLEDCEAAVGQAQGAQAAIFEAMTAMGVTVKRIRDIADQLQVMTGQRADDEQLNEAEEKALGVMAVLGELLVEAAAEERKAADAIEDLKSRVPMKMTQAEIQKYARQSKRA